jgi:hypothetical protein
MPIRTSARALGSALLLVTVAGATFSLGVGPAAAMQLGGWRSAATDDGGVQAAASFAAGEVGGSLDRVDAAETQSAAGTNFRLTIVLEDGAIWQVVVHRNLQGEFAMQSSTQTYVPAGEGPDTGSNDGSDDDD